jgi:hypothetical protein
MARDTDRRPETPIEVYIFLAIGAVLGTALLIHPLIFVSWWWTPLLDALREGERAGVWKPALVLLSVLAGLAVMFGLIQPARKYERTDQTLRRIVYGYNSVLTGILVLLMLVIVNVGIHVWAPRYLDATEGGFHSISDVTRTFVTELERPTKVYVVLPESDETQRNMLTLLGQLTELNPRNFSYEDVSPTLNQSRFRELNKLFPQFNGAGLIVAMGDQPEKNYSFIPANELENADVDPMTGRQKSREFSGEVRLMQELSHLAVSKKKPVVYFTQGHGEPDLTSPREDGLASLQLKLMRENYDVRPLKMAASSDPKDAKVPDDADVVVVVGPQKSMADTIPALEQYMQSPRGRMVAFLGPTPPDRGKNNAMTETGLEKLLGEFNVDATNETVFTFAIPAGDRFRLDQSPERVILGPYTSALDARQPLAVTFKDQVLQWYDCRQIRPTTRNPNYDAEPLMGSVGLVWTETDMLKRPADQHMLMQRDPAERKKRIREETLPIVVAVTEKPAEPGKPGQSRKPKLLVFGSSLFLTNQFQGRGAGTVDADLARSAIDWCRERYSSIGIQPKTYNSFVPGKISVPRLIVIPSVLMLTAILGFGLVVWNARRR